MKDTAKKGIDKMTKILDELEKVSPEVGDIYRKMSQKNVWSLAKHMNGSIY